jgi:uncharacterized protein
MDEHLPEKGTGLGILRSLSQLIARANFGRAAGITYAGKRDAYETLGYKRVLTSTDYRSRYDRGGMAASIVDAKPDATWRGSGDLVEDENPEVVTAFESQWYALAERLQVWPMCRRADILAGLGEFSIILIGAPGELTQPLEKVASPDQIFDLSVFSQLEASVQNWESTNANNRIGKPEFYKVKKVDQNNKDLEKPVHWSRILHIADGCLESNYYGTPRLERVWNLLDDLDKVTGGGSEAFWARANQGMNLDVDPEMKISPEALARLEEEAEEYQHNIRRIMRTRGVDVKMLGSDVANFGPQAAAIVDQISAATRIPQRILMGAERGELASSQDKLNWDDLITDRRSSFAEAVIIRPLITRFQQIGALPQAIYDVRWPKIANMSDDKRADIVATIAKANADQGEFIMETNELRDRVLDLPPRDVLPGEMEQPELIAASLRTAVAKKKFIARQLQKQQLRKRLALVESSSRVLQLPKPR